MADLISMLAAAGGAGGEVDPNFNQTVLLLHGDGTNGAQNNTFLDSSTNNFTITRNGNTTQGTFSPFSAPDGRWSNYFDGSNDYLAVPYNSALNFSGDFTVEAWIYLTGNAATDIDGNRAAAIYATNENVSGDPVMFFYVRGDASTTGTGFGLRFGNSGSITGPLVTATITKNEWHHIAVCRSSGTVYAFLDGVSQSYTGTALAATMSTTFGRRIGRYVDTGYAWFFPGYISNLRHTNEALYTSNFTPSTSPLTTTSQGASSANIALLTCQSNRFVDNSTNAIAITPNGGAKVTPFSPFAPTAAYSASVNGGSGYFDGANDWLNLANNADFDFGSSDLTIECWFYLTGNAAVNPAGTRSAQIFNAFPNSGTRVDDYDFRVDGDGSTTGTGLTFRTTISGSSQSTTYTATITKNTWHHFAAVKSGNTVSLFYDGVRVQQNASVTNQVNSGGNPIKIGALRFTDGASQLYDSSFPGYISNLRVLNGTALYSGTTYTVPTGPLTAIANTVLLTNFTNAGIFDNTGKNNLETVGNAQIDTTTKKFGTGSMEFDGTGDALHIASNPSLYLSTGNFTIEGWVYTTDSTVNQTVMIRRSSVTARGFIVAINTFVSQKLSFACGDSDTAAWEVQLDSTTSLANNTWYHFAVVRDGNDFELFINGVSEDTANNSVVIADDTSLLRIGLNDSGSSGLNGFIDDLRITKGVARYTTTFTPPTKAFPDL